MAALTRILFPIIGYVCVATVITIGAGYGYLRQTNVLDDQRMFRIVSLLHGIDLDEIADAHVDTADDVPPEELSYDQQQEHLQVASLHLQAKQDEIEKEIDEFDNRFKAITSLMAQFNNFREEVETFLNQRRQEAIDSGIVAVRSQLKTLDAKKQVKGIIINMYTEGRTDQIISLLDGMPPRNRTEILKKFTTDEELEILYDIQKQMLAGDPEKSFIDSKLNELKQRQE